ncbi:MAG: amino acid ABC transporter permease, partial [Ornithinibacter sp.]
MTSQTSERPGLIEARPVRHPGRWVAVAAIVVFAAMIISSFVTNEKWNFPFAFQIMQQSPVLEGLWKGTIFGTVGAMILGISLGILMAVMRLSDNPVLRGVAFVYTWFFRAIPRYVLLVLLGVGLGFLYPVFDIGVPFGQQIAGALGIETDLTLFTINYNNISSTIWVGILGLGLSEAAYMAEI